MRCLKFSEQAIIVIWKICSNTMKIFWTKFSVIPLCVGCLVSDDVNSLTQMCPMIILGNRKARQSFKKQRAVNCEWCDPIVPSGKPNRAADWPLMTCYRSSYRRNHG